MFHEIVPLSHDRGSSLTTRLYLLREHPAWILIRLYVTKSADQSLLYWTPVRVATRKDEVEIVGRQEIARSQRRRPASYF